MNKSGCICDHDFRARYKNILPKIRRDDKSARVCVKTTSSVIIIACFVYNIIWCDGSVRCSGLWYGVTCSIGSVKCPFSLSLVISLPSRLSVKNLSEWNIDFSCMRLKIKDIPFQKQIKTFFGKMFSFQFARNDLKWKSLYLLFYNWKPSPYTFRKILNFYIFSRDFIKW